MAKTETRRINIWINGKEVQNTVKDITASWKRLVAEQAHMTVGSKEYLAHATKIKQLKGLIDDHKRQIGSIATAWQKAKDTIVATGFGVLGGNVLTALTTRIGGFFTNIITGATKMADQFSDIRKTTGMTMEEVEALSGSLSKIDTRTSTSDLREMAIVAGQLGIAKDDVMGFVEAVDKTAVALGDEFTGGAEEVATVMGKLRNVLTDMKSGNVGEDLLHISNAVNELGAAGFATGPVISDFANRIGGSAIPLGMTSGQVLGLSATLQELNVATERGGTAITKILGKMTTDTDKFARVAGMSIKEYEDLVNNDLYAAFVKVIEGSRNSGTAATALSGIIDELGVDGAGAREVFMKLGTSIGMLNEKVDLASTSLLSTDSILAEFNLKNENLAGQWEKAKKALNGIVMGIGKQLAPAIVSIVKGFVSLLEWVKRNADSLKVFLKVLILGASAMIAYNVAAKISLALKKLLKKATDDDTTATIKNTLGQKIAAAATYLYTAAVALLSGNLKKAAVAMRAFSIVTKMNPIGLLVGIVTAVVGALALFRSRMTQASIATESWARVNKNAKEGVGDMVGKVNEYRFMLKRAHGNQDEFNRIVKEWNSEIGSKYKVSLDAATASLEDIDKAANGAAKAIMGMAVVSAISNEIKELTETNIDAVGAWINAEDSVAQATENLAKKQAELKEVMANPIDQKQINDALEAVNSAQKRLDQAKKGGYSAEARAMVDQGKAVQLQIESLIAYQEKLKTKLGMSDIETNPETDGGDITETPLSEEGAEKQKELKNKYLDIYEQLQEKIREISKKFQLDGMTDEEKELQEVENKYDDLIEINTGARAEISALGKKADKEDLETYRKLMDQLVQLEKMKGEEQLAITDKYAKLKAEKRLEVEEQIRVALLSTEDKEKEDIIKKYQALIKLAQEYGFDTVELYKKMQEELEALKNKKGKTDVLGMSAEDWEKLKKNFDEVESLMRKLGEAANDINTIITNGEQKRMQQIEANYNKEMEKVETMYAQKHLSEAAYNDRKKKLENDFAAQKLANERRQAKRKKDIATFEAILDTASAVVEALPNIPLSILMGVLGGIQIAAIRSEPVPQLYTGGFTAKSSNNMQPAGTVHANEWVSPAWMVNSPVTGPIISQLEAIRSSGNARGSVSVPQVRRNMAQQGSGDVSSHKLDVLIAQNSKLLKYMSDPDNRRAIIVHDTYTKYQKDIAEMQKLRKIS